LLFCLRREQSSQEQEVIPPTTSAPDTSIDVFAVVDADEDLGTRAEPVIPIAFALVEAATQGAKKIAEASAPQQGESEKRPTMDLPLIPYVGEAISTWWAFTQGPTISKSPDCRLNMLGSPPRGISMMVD